MGLSMNTVLTVKEASDKFSEFLKEQKRASATILAYDNDIRQLEKFLKEKNCVAVDMVNMALLNEFKADLEQKSYIAKSISRKINSIKTFFRFLKNEGSIENDPSLTIIHPKYEVSPPRILSLLEYRALRDSCRGNTRMSALIELLLQTGIRIAEAANLTLNDIKDSEINIKPNESHGERNIPLNKAAKEALNRYLVERSRFKEKTVFITKTGRPFLIRNIRSSVERYFEIAGIKNATVNDLRHTWIYHHLASGTPLVVISKLAGHKRITTTERYLKLVGEKKSESLKLEEL